MDFIQVDSVNLNGKLKAHLSIFSIVLLQTVHKYFIHDLVYSKEIYSGHGISLIKAVIAFDNQWKILFDKRDRSTFLNIGDTAGNIGLHLPFEFVTMCQQIACGNSSKD
jgi:hypothetical protein